LILIKDALFLLLAFFDAEFTKRRLSEFGIGIELNPVVRWLSKRIGISFGVTLGVTIPTGCLIVAGWYVPGLIEFMLGIRFCLFLFQWRSITKD